MMALKGHNTYEHWAQNISDLSGRTLSKQGLFDRMGLGAVQMVHNLLKERLLTVLKKGNDDGLFSSFLRVFIQDSTTLLLPKSLIHHFPGNSNGNGTLTAIARIQCIYNLLNNQFYFFGLTPYTANDQSASTMILEVIKKGDLVIRDLGYFVLDTLVAIKKKEAFFLSRCVSNITVYKLAKNDKFNILKIIGKRNFFDDWVLLGEQAKVKVRLVIIKLPEHIASVKRRKALNHNDKRFTYSKKYLKLAGYVFYVTNVTDKIWKTSEVAAAYKNRWTIEILFKSWKSHFKIQTLIHKQCYNYERVVCIIYMMLLFISIFHLKIFLPYSNKIKVKHHQIISILKLAKQFSINFTGFICKSKMEIERFLLKFCCYEMRSDRHNQDDLLCSNKF
jgi:hypothetical protein